MHYIGFVDSDGDKIIADLFMEGTNEQEPNKNNGRTKR